MFIVALLLILFETCSQAVPVEYDWCEEYAAVVPAQLEQMHLFRQRLVGELVSVYCT